MAKKTAKKKKTNGRKAPLVLDTEIIPVSAWKSREDALDYMQGEFHGWCDVVQDLVTAGVHVPSLLVLDLGEIAALAAEFIASPAPVEATCDSFEYADALVRCLRELRERTADGGYIGFEAADGWAEVSASTYPLLARALQNASKSYESEARSWWDAEMESRRAACPRGAAAGVE